MHAIEYFEMTIKQHEDQLFGIYLFNEGIKYLHANNPDFKTIYGEDALDTADFHYKEIMKRGKKAISEAKELLEKVINQTEDIKALSKFQFPPIHGSGLDEMTQRATLLFQAYEKLFPRRSRDLPLTVEENEKLIHEVTSNF